MIVKSFEIQKKVSNFLKYKLFLLYGENEGLKKDIKQSIKESLSEKYNNIEIINFYENDINNENEENFNNSIFSGSLFSDKKLINIIGAKDKVTKQIKNIIDKCPENVTIVIFADLLEKKSSLRNFFETSNETICIPCYLDNERDLEIIIRNDLKKDNINLSREIVNLLIEKSNYDRNNLKNEINKIKSYAINKKNLTIDEVKSLINFSGEFKSDSLVNECLCGNITQYKKILSELYLNNNNQILFFRILSRKTQRLLSMKEMEVKFSNLDNLLNSCKPPIFWKEKPLIKKQLSIWGHLELKKIIQEINKIEVLCKKNPQISNAIFFNFFSKICVKASSFS